MTAKTDFLEQLVHFTTGARVEFALFAIVLVTEKVVPNERIVYQTLQNNIHEARLTEI